MEQVGQVFTRTGRVLLALTVVPFALVWLIVHADGPGEVPWVFIGGAVGVYGFHYVRSGVRKRVLGSTSAKVSGAAKESERVG